MYCSEEHPDFVCFIHIVNYLLQEGFFVPMFFLDNILQWRPKYSTHFDSFPTKYATPPAL
jgi:hypothetical protein